MQTETRRGQKKTLKCVLLTDREMKSTFYKLQDKIEENRGHYVK